jgi:hypothetical protein
MKKINLNEGSQQDLPVIARKKGQAGIVFINKNTGKPDPTSYMSAAEVTKLSKQDQEKLKKYIDPDKFAAIEKRNRDRQAQIEAEKQRLKGVGNPPTAPAPPSGGSGTTTTSKPPVSSPPIRRPAPTPETKAVSGYMSAAAAARKSGDAAQMAKVRDTGLDIWRKKYATTLAKNVNPDGTQKGTGQSVMAKQAAELRNLRQPTAPVPQVQAKSSLPGGDYSPAATAQMSQRTKNILGTRKEAYDIVLEYLLSQGHVDTLEEALYVMLEMDSKCIQSIVEGVMPEPIDPTAHKEAQRLARQQGKVRALEAGATTPGEQQAAQSKLRGPQLPGV